MAIRLEDVPDKKPIRLSDIEDKPIRLSDVRSDSSPQALASQFGLGLINEALLGAPRAGLKKLQGEEAVEKLEPKGLPQKIARGAGQLAGFLTPGPQKVFQVGRLLTKGARAGVGAVKGAKAIDAAIRSGIGLKNANRLGRFVTRGSELGIGLGMLEAVQFDKSIEEKKVTVPSSVITGGLIGGVAGLAEPAFVRFLQRRGIIPRRVEPKTVELKKLQQLSDKAGKTPESVKLKVRRIGNKLETEIVDQNAPLRHLEEELERFAGKKIKFVDKASVQAEKFLGVGGKIQDRIITANKIVNPVAADKQTLFDIMRAERMVERGLKGQANPRGLTSQSANKALNDIRTQIGDAKFKDLSQRSERLRREVFDEILRDAKGVFSEEDISRMLAENKFYVPFEVLEYVEKNIGEIPRGAKVLKTSIPGFFKKTKGTLKDVIDTEESIARYIANTTRFVESNKVVNKLVDLRKVDPFFKDLIIPLGKKGVAPKDFAKISAIRNGIKESYAVPEEIASTINGLNTKTVDLISRMAGRTGNALRLGATQLNTAFLVPNIFRDFQMAKLSTRLGFSVGDWVRGFASAVGKDNLYRQWLREGAAISGFQGVTSARIPKIGRTISDKVKSAVNPVKWLEEVARVSEQSTRIGVFNRALKQGFGVEEAVNLSRNATIDFAKMGNTMRLANMWVPFLAARTKGTVNILASAKRNPKLFALRASYLITAPLLATYAWNNTQFPDVWNDIARFEKDNNFILIYGREKDVDGRWTQVAKIPKGDVGRVIANPIENFLEFMQQKDARSAQQVFLQTLSDISPVEFARESKIAPEAILSTALPPIIKAPAEGVSNFNFFTGREIVPKSLQKKSPQEQFKTTTSPTAIALGDLLNISPMKIENFFGTALGGVGRQILDPTRFATGVGRRFSGTFGNETENRMFELLEEIETDEADAKGKISRNARLSFEEFKQLPPVPEIRRKFVENKIRQNKEIRDQFLDFIEAEGRGELPFDRKLQRTSVDNRLKFIFRASREFGFSDEQKAAFLKRMIDKKIVTEKALKQFINKR